MERTKTQTIIDIAFNIDIFINYNHTHQVVDYTINGVQIILGYNNEPRKVIFIDIPEYKIELTFLDIDIPDIVDRIDKITKSLVN